MCQTFQRCTIFHFGYSKIFVPFISSGSNLHQFLTAYSLLSKGIRLFTPNFTLILFTFPAKPKQYFSTNQIARMTSFDQSEYDQKFSIFLHYLHTILGDFCSILRHNSNPLSFQCSQPLYIPLHFSFSSFQRRFIKKAGRKLSIQNSLFQGYPYFKEWK